MQISALKSHPSERMAERMAERSGDMRRAKRMAKPARLSPSALYTIANNNNLHNLITANHVITDGGAGLPLLHLSGHYRIRGRGRGGEGRGRVGLYTYRVSKAPIPSQLTITPCSAQVTDFTCLPTFSRPNSYFPMNTLSFKSSIFHLSYSDSNFHLRYED